MHKKEVLLIIFLIISVFFISNISAVDGCWIEDRTACTGDDYILMGLSDTTNAHGELYNQENYDKVLCCNFGNGVQPGECTGGTEFLSLSSETNAHAETPELTNYANDICYQHTGLDCVSGTENPDTDTYDALLSLSGETNAHIGHPGDYETRIFCSVSWLGGTYCGDGVKQTPNDQGVDEDCDDGNNINGDGCENNCVNTPGFITLAYWSDDYSSPSSGNALQSKTVHVGFTTVYLVFENSKYETYEEAEFKIYEKDTFSSDDLIKTIIENPRNEFGDIVANWTISQSDLEATKEQNPDEFYFQVYDKGDEELGYDPYQSGDLDLTIESSPICEAIFLCSDYSSQSTCENDANLCEVAGYSVEANNENLECGTDVSCNCYWNETENFCNSMWTSPDGGKCNYITETDDDCSDNFIHYLFQGIWTAGDNPDDSLEAECKSGEKTVPCPAQVQLPGFNIYNVIGIIILIILIYFAINLRKKRKSSKPKTKKKSGSGKTRKKGKRKNKKK